MTSPSLSTKRIMKILMNIIFLLLFIYYYDANIANVVIVFHWNLKALTLIGGG
ncbi:hypothetical protein D3C76_57240 [compost metagenome]